MSVGVCPQLTYKLQKVGDFVTRPKSGIQAFIVMHKGKVVYERYPGMKPSDSHVWASTAKPIVGLLLEQLIDEGKISQNGTYGQYVPDFRGTAWENIRILDIMNMASWVRACMFHQIVISSLFTFLPILIPIQDSAICVRLLNLDFLINSLLTL